MKKLPEVIWLTPDHEDPDYIVWQNNQPADSDKGVEYIRADVAERLGRMAYIATEPITGECFGISLASSKNIPDHIDDVYEWKKKGAIIELLPLKEAQARWGETRPCPKEPVCEIAGHGGGCE